MVNNQYHNIKEKKSWKVGIRHQQKKRKKMKIKASHDYKEKMLE